MADSGTSIAEEARQIRKAILERHGYSQDGSVPGAGQMNPIEDAASLARVTSHWGITSSVPLFGPALVLIRRVMRIALRWYVNPIVEQQNAFNDATVRALFELQTENDRLRALVSADQDSAERA